MVQTLVNIAEWASDNLLAVWIGKRAADGHFAGWDELEADDTGSDSGMRRLTGGITYPIAIPQQATARTRGDGKTLANWQRNADQDNQYILDMAIRDLIAEDFFAGKNSFTLGYYRRIGLLGSASTRPKSSTLLLHRAAQSMEADTLNAGGYENLLVFDNKIAPLGDDQFQQDQVGGSRYQGIANRIVTSPWGVKTRQLAGMSDGITASWVTEYPDMIHCFVGDGATDIITVDLEPVDNDLERIVIVDFTASLAANDLVYATAIDVDVAAREIQASANLTDESIYMVQYQFAPELL